MNKSLVMSGMVAALGSMLLIGGCKTEVMGARQYVPAEKTPAPMTVVESETVVVDEPVAQETAPKKAEAYPAIDTVVPKKAAASTSGKAAPSAAAGSYVVKSGDTIGSIAKAHGLGYKSVLAANGMTEADARKLKVGRKLVIPAKGSTASMSATAAKAGKTAAAKGGAKTVAKTTAATASADGAIYVVKTGDTIPKIAKQLGVKASALQAANNLDDAATRRLQIGQKLVIPGKGGAAAVAATTPAAPVQSDAALDAAASALAAAPATTATVATEGAAPAVTAPAAPATEAAAPTVTETAVAGSAIPVEILEDTKLDDFLKSQKITLETFKKLNSDIVVTDGMLKVNTVVFVPGVE